MVFLLSWDSSLCYRIFNECWLSLHQQLRYWMLDARKKNDYLESRIQNPAGFILFAGHVSLGDADEYG